MHGTHVTSLQEASETTRHQMQKNTPRMLINCSTYPEIPNANLATQTARGEDVIMRGVEGQAPWCSWMASEDVRTLASGDVGDTHSVVTMSRGNLGSETTTKIYKINKNVYKAQAQKSYP